MYRLTSVAVVTITVIVIIALGIEARAKEKRIHKKDVPKAVLSAFEKTYPTAKVKGYTTGTEEGKTYYEIESHQGKMSLDVSYLGDGTVAEIEEGVTVESLPDAVKATLKANYPKGKIAKAEKRTVGSNVTYELKITTGKTHAGVEIEPNGNIIKKSNRGEEKEEKD